MVARLMLSSSVSSLFQLDFLASFQNRDPFRQEGLQPSGTDPPVDFPDLLQYLHDFTLIDFSATGFLPPSRFWTMLQHPNGIFR